MTPSCQSWDDVFLYVRRVVSCALGVWFSLRLYGPYINACYVIARFYLHVLISFAAVIISWATPPGQVVGVITTASAFCWNPTFGEMSIFRFTVVPTLSDHWLPSRLSVVATAWSSNILAFYWRCFTYARNSLGLTKPNFSICRHGTNLSRVSLGGVCSLCTAACTHTAVCLNLYQYTNLIAWDFAKELPEYEKVLAFSGFHSFATFAVARRLCLGSVNAIERASGCTSAKLVVPMVGQFYFKRGHWGRLTRSGSKFSN